MHLKFLEKQEVKPKSSIWKEMIKIKAEVNKMEEECKESMKQKVGPLKR
jgi:hypothetical protein